MLRIDGTDDAAAFSEELSVCDSEEEVEYFNFLIYRLYQGR